MKIFSWLKINIKGLCIFCFVLFILYLAGGYLGGGLEYLYLFFLFLFLYSILFLLFSLFGLKFSQFFSTDHPVKGETINYKLILANELPFGIPQVKSCFATSNPLMETMVPDFTESLPRKSRKEFNYDISCAYRGIYRVGLESVQITDFLNLFSINVSVWHKTFYVYPKIINLERFIFGPESFFSSGTQAARTGVDDVTLFRGINDYRPERPLHNVYWKKTAALGRPVVKQYDKASNPSVAIYPDLYNPLNEKTIPILEREDVSVEIVCALVKYYLENMVEVSVRSPCQPVFDFRGYNQDDFHRFYKISINLFSGPYPSPFELLRSDRGNGYLDSKSIIFITHRMEARIFNFAMESVKSKLRVLIIFNHVSSHFDDQKTHHQIFNSLRDQGVNILEVMSPESIAHDLENHQYG